MIPQFPSDHENPKDSQVLIAITGTPEAIKERLKCIMKDIGEYSKPMQGTLIGSDYTSSVITPIWGKKRY